MIYKFRRDKQAVSTAVVMALFAIFIICEVCFVAEEDMWVRILCHIIILPIFLLGLRTPRYVYIEKGLIIVKYYLGRKILADIASVRRVTKDELAGSVRLMGNNGLFGYTGWHRKKGIGTYYLMAVNWEELALVTLENGKLYVINYPQELLDKAVNQ